MTTTNLFRADVDWIRLVKYAYAHFGSKKNIGVYSLAASDGSEAYTYLISVMEKIPKKLYEKFGHVNASDFDKEVINGYKSGRVNVYAREFWQAENKYKVDLTKYLKNRSLSVVIKGDDVSGTDVISSYEPIPELRDSINYKQSDILSELKNIDDNGNSIVLCRNVFPYLNDDYIDEIIETAKEKLKPKSLFVTGNYDQMINIRDKLLKSGFYQPIKKEPNIFERKA